MTSRIKQLFSQQKAYIGYITVGDGGLKHSLNVAKALLKGGVNMLELGVPFSDPIADGPVIQRASQRALAAHTHLLDVIKLAAQLRQLTTIPLILFSYYNPLLAAVPKQWLPAAQAAGIDGVLAVDLPVEEGEDFYAACVAHAIAPISVITPATSVTRLRKILHHTTPDGFLYYACRTGTTGVRSGLPAGLAEKIMQIKAHTSLPVVVGFGIADADVVKEILTYADGFVVGSFFVKALEEHIPLEQLTHLTRSLCC